jgi:hypothetical protein
MESIPSFLPSKFVAAVVHAEVHLQKREETHRHRNRLESPKTKLDEAQNEAQRSPTKPKTKPDEAQNEARRSPKSFKQVSVKGLQCEITRVARWRGGRVAGWQGGRVSEVKWQGGRSKVAG